MGAAFLSFRDECFNSIPLDTNVNMKVSRHHICWQFLCDRRAPGVRGVNILQHELVVEAVEI